MVGNVTASQTGSASNPADEPTICPLPATGYFRLHQITGRPARNGHPAIPALIPVSRSTWWAGVKSGRYPQPVRTLGKTLRSGG